MASEDAPALHTSISVLGKYFDLPSLKVFCYLCYANRADWEERVKTSETAGIGDQVVSPITAGPVPDGES